MPPPSTVLRWLPWYLLGAWSALALLFADGGPTAWRFVVLAASIGCAVLLHRSAPGALAPVGAGLFMAVALWFFTRTARDDRNWMLEQSRMPWVTFDPSGFTVHDQRAFRWVDPEAPVPAWTNEHYAWADLQGADLGISRFSDFRPMAHTFVSVRFASGQVLVVSVEIRKEQGETFGPVRGLFRSYERMVVLGDEQDLVGLRAVHLGERVVLLPLQVGPAKIEAFVRAVIDETNALHAQPAWYNTVTASCSTTLAAQLQKLGELPWDVRILFPGLLDELAWERGWLGDQPLPTLLEAHDVDPGITDWSGSYSRRIRAPR